MVSARTVDSGPLWRHRPWKPHRSRHSTCPASSTRPVGRYPAPVSRSDLPVIGRHSRDHWTKWPADRNDLLAAYPESPDVDVRIMGGAETARKLLGSSKIPLNWVAYDYDEVGVPGFLYQLDFYVYFPHPHQIEAFGPHDFGGTRSRVRDRAAAPLRRHLRGGGRLLHARRGAPVDRQVLRRPGGVPGPEPDRRRTRTSVPQPPSPITTWLSTS